MNKELKNQIYLLYALNFFKDLNLITVLLSPFMITQGLSLSDFVIVASVFRITQTLFSIPAGIFSDKIHPRRSLQISAILYFCSFLSLLPSDLSFINFALFNFLNSLSVCFILTSSNKHLKSLVENQTLFIRVYSKKISLRKLGAMISGLVASIILVAFSYKAVLVFQLMMAVVVLLITLQLKQILRLQPEERIPVLNFNQVFKLIKESSFSAVLFLAIPFFMTTDVLLQPLIVKLGVSTSLFPVVVAFFSFLIFLSINQSSKIVNHFKVSPFVSVFLSILPMGVVFLTHNYMFALGAMVLTILSRSSSVVEMGKFINEIPKEQQGFMESILNTTAMLIVGSSAFVFGLLMKTISFEQSAGIFFFGGLLAAAIWLKFKK